MDNSPDGVSLDLLATAANTGETLSYDDTIPYEEQIPAAQEQAASLAKRIGIAKVYLLSDTSVARVGKRKLSDEEEESGGNVNADDEMDEDLSYRANAVLLHGPPIAHLPTARLFAYAKHFQIQPMGLEWIDDTTCVLVFPSKTLARAAYAHLQKSTTEGPDMENFVTAHSIPMALWPAEERIGASLGKAQGLKGTIKMRWAVEGDVKKKDAMKESNFYRKHGRLAGKEVYGGEGAPAAAKRRKGEQEDDAAIIDSESQKVQLDDELDRFLAEDGSEEEVAPPLSPPSKMRSDYIGRDGRTLLERTSISAQSDLASRIAAPLPRRARTNLRGAMNGAGTGDGLSSRISMERVGSPRRRGGRKGERRPRRGEPKKCVTQQELDEEMDAFWKEQS